MIDCENEVYTRIVDVLEVEYEGINTSTDYDPAPASFPHVSIVNTDNYEIEANVDSGDYETAKVTFEVNIYSNNISGKKAECKKISETIDRIFKSMNFRRLACGPIPNMKDLSIYRMVMRYQGISDGTNFYGR